MRDIAKFENLLEKILAGDPVAEAAWEPYRDHASILITDLSGFTRLTLQLGTARMLALIHGMRRIAVPILEAHGGIPVKYQADDLFAAFKTAHDALSSAVALQEALRAPDPPLPAPVRLCMGIGCGEVLWWGSGDLYGEEVNVASRLGEDTAEADEILLTRAAVDEVLAVKGRVRFSRPRSLSMGGSSYEYFAYLGGLGEVESLSR